MRNKKVNELIQGILVIAIVVTVAGRLGSWENSYKLEGTCIANSGEGILVMDSRGYTYFEDDEKYFNIPVGEKLIITFDTNTTHSNLDDDYIRKIGILKK